MHSTKLSCRLPALMAILTVTFFVTGAYAADGEKVLHSFSSSATSKGGSDPAGGLIFDAAGNLYGTTVYSGAGACTAIGGAVIGCGTVFELSPKSGGGWTEKVLYSFKNDGMDANFPLAGLVFDRAGNLYGTSDQGGIFMCDGGYTTCGTVFELIPKANGSWGEKVLHDFDDNGTDGFHPRASLTLDAAGNLYGTTWGGGGVAFELTTATDENWTETILHSFGNGTDGAAPQAGLIFDASGNLYGTTALGGAYEGGTVFELTPSSGGVWTENILHNFDPYGPKGYSLDGYYPSGTLIFDTAGNLYGATLNGGGNYNDGAVFELTPATSGWTETILHKFGHRTDGYNPIAGLIFDVAGNLYGTTNGGGVYNYGTVFEMTPAAGGSWTETVLHDFGHGVDGSEPYSGSLIFDANGNLYGTTVLGGTGVGGTVFEITR